METITVHGMHMAKLGLGTWQMRDEACSTAVAGALQMGYRHIDTAEMYGNEEAVGHGIRRGGVHRDDIHVTSKVWWEHLSPTEMVAAVDASLGRLGMDYVDLYLVHWPKAGMDVPAVMDTLESIRESGKARAIGVANFPSALLRQAVEAGAPIACNQVEYHVMLSQDRLLETMRPLGIPLVAYSPLAKGGLVEHATLRSIAEKHGASPAQVALKWLLDQPGVAAIPKASRPESQRANLDALRIQLDDEDRAAIAALPKDQRSVNPAFAPAWD